MTKQTISNDLPAGLDYIDLSAEQTAMMPHNWIRSKLAWTAADIDLQRCKIELDDDVNAELHNIITQSHEHPLPLLLRDPQHFEMRYLSSVMQRVKNQLDSQIGVAVVDGLPLDEMAFEDAQLLFWLLGQFIDRPVAQKWDGTMLYDVRDTGQRFGYGVRGSYTNVELVFHTDNAFSEAPPDYVGLLCLRPAKEGGISRFCSLYSVHDRMLAQYPKLLQRLYRPMLFDRQAEHAPHAAKHAYAPMFRFNGKRLMARANVSLIKKGYDLAGIDMDVELSAAIAALEAITTSSDLWFELPLERGHLQYLNNAEIAHYRSEFSDYDDPSLRRHLLRSWHRQRGRPSYSG